MKEKEMVRENFASGSFPKIKKLFAEISAALYRAAENSGFTVGEKISAQSIALYGLLAGISLLAGAFAVSAVSFPMNVRPIGISLISAAGNPAYKENRNLSLMNTVAALIVFSGVLLSSTVAGDDAVLYFCVYFASFIIRCALCRGRLNENITVRVTFSVVTAFLFGAIRAVMNGFVTEDAVRAVALVITAPIFTYLLSGIDASVFAGTAENEKTAQKTETALCCVFFLLLYSVKEAEVFGISLSLTATAVAVLFAARSRSSLYGAAIGIIGGMACRNAALAAPLAVSGFFAGIFFEYSDILAVAASFTVAAGYSLYSGGFAEFSSVVPEICTGGVLFFVISRFTGKSTDGFDFSVSKPDPSGREALIRTKRKLSEMSDAFSSLSEVFYTVSADSKKPQFTEVSLAVSNCFSEVCSSCPRSSECWGSEYSSTAESTAAIATRLIADGKVTESDFDAMKTKCKMTEKLCKMVNTAFVSGCGGYCKNNKTSLLVGEYNSVSKLIKNTAAELDRELELNPALEKKARRALASLGIRHTRAVVFGTREMKIDVYGVMLENVKVSGEEISHAFFSEFGFPFSEPEFVMNGDRAVMRLSRRRKLLLECAKAGCTKRGESVNGDSTSFFENGRDFFYTLICDGMGSGREAAFTSRIASVFIEKLMDCASPKSVTIDMLNTFLMSRSEETFTTVDMLEIDLLSGEGNFIKAGAEASFVLRGNSIKKVESRTPPAGIISGICAEQTKMTFCDGDIIIMISDGASSENGDPDWLLSVLSERTFSSAGDACEAVFEAAKEKTSFRDDLSVSALKVTAA